MTYQVLCSVVASITDLKKNPMKTAMAGNGSPVAILCRHKPAFYIVSPELFDYFHNLAEDEELNRIADERMQEPDLIDIDADDWNMQI